MALTPHAPEIAEVIQLAIAPVFMLTAVGTIIGALNIRLGRAVDRRRGLERSLARLRPEEAIEASAELETIARRVHFVYLAILSAVISGLFVCLLIAGMFIGAFVRADVSNALAVLFVCAVLALVACLLLFLREIFLAVSTPRHVAR